MADTSVGGLYIRLGLSLSELETGFITASQTVAANISRLNREADLIRLRAEVEIAGLDEVNDAERILQIRTESLNQRIAIQRDRIRLLSAAYRDVARTQGETSVAAQRAAIRLERERLALANLERDLRSLSETQDETNGVLGELSNMLPAIPTKLQAVGAAAGAVAAGVGAAGAATKELIEEFRELQRQSYELNMPFADTREFLREMKLAGGDIGDIEGYIRGISDAWAKGEYDDPEFIALRKYGAEIVDETGRLKNFKDITNEVYRAWKQADAAGEGIEFLQLTGGEMGIRDIIQYFQRLEEAKEDAAKIFTAKIDDKELHELDRTLNKVEMQSQELKAALGDIFVPAVQSAAEKFFDTLHDASEFLVESKDTFQRWGFIAAETFDMAAEKAGGFVDKLAEFAKTPKGTTGDAKTDKIMADMGWRYQEFKPQTPWGVNTDWDNFNKASKSYGILGGIVERTEERQKKYNDAVQDGTKSWADFRRETEKLEKNDDVLSQYAQQRINEFKDELEDIQIELDFGDNDYAKALAELDLWRDRELTDKLRVSSEERAAIEELYAAKLKQIEQEHADEIQKHWQNAADIQYELTHSSFEKQMRDIELWKDAELEKAATAEDTAAVIANAAAKEAKAFEDAVDRIKGKVQTLEDKIFEIDHSQYENDLRKIQQDYLRQAQEYQELGIFTPEVKAQLDYLYGRQKQQLDARADESRRTGGDYTKAPEGAMQRGGNNIVVIGADQIIDDGLKRANIGVMVDERNIRAQLLPKISQEARDVEAAAQATRDLTDVQKQFAQQANSFQLIEGDRDAASNFQQIEGDQFISAPTAELQQLGDALQQTAADIEQADPAQKIAQAESALTQTLSQAATDFPADYFKNLADGVKAVSDTQLALTRSTLDLIDAQSKWKDALKNMPQPAQGELPTDGFQRLSASTLDLRKTQDLIARQTRELTPLPTAKKQDSGFELGFDHDLFGTLTTASTTLIGLLRAAGAIAPHPAVKLGAIALGGALGAATGKGTAEATDEAHGQPQYDERLKEFSPDVDLTGLTTSLNNIDEKIQSVLQKLQRDEQTTESKSDFSEIVTPLTSIDEKIQAILQKMQDVQPHKDDGLQKLFGTLPSLESAVENIFQAMQAKPPENNKDTIQPEITFSELVSQLENIERLIQGIRDNLPGGENLESDSPTPAKISFSDLVAPLTQIDSKAQNILQVVQEKQFPSDDKSQELFGKLSSIEAELQNILQELQSHKDTSGTPAEIPAIETIDYLPQLNSINDTLRDVLNELQRDAAGNTSTPELDLSDVTTPLAAVDAKLQDILREIQKRSAEKSAEHSPDDAQKFFGALLNIESYKHDILQKVQGRQGDVPESFYPAGLDLSAVITPLTSIDQKFDSLLHSLQRDDADNFSATFGGMLSEKLGALPNIESYSRDILTAVQSINFPTETIVTPLSNIAGNIQQILAALQNREMPDITVSPNISVNLGGAYVFDDALKKALVNDITSDVVVSIKDAVQQATSKSSYGYSA